jgi:hypothetical protein
MDKLNFTAAAAVTAAATAAAISINQLHTNKSFITAKIIIKYFIMKNNIYRGTGPEGT